MSILIETLKGKKTKTPIWLMRQAGRHLPEYIKIRQKYKDLMEMFLDPEAITKISLQPVERYELDACIVFSDILMIPYALTVIILVLIGVRQIYRVRKVPIESKE